MTLLIHYSVHRVCLPVYEMPSYHCGGDCEPYGRDFLAYIWTTQVRICRIPIIYSHLNL
jgi:hypothetical protein